MVASRSRVGGGVPAGGECAQRVLAEDFAGMKICFLCNEYPPVRHGGVGIATRTIGRAMVEAGHQVRVIGLNWENSDSPRVESDHGVKVWRLKTHKSFLGWVRS